MNFNDYQRYLYEKNLINTPESLPHIFKATKLTKFMRKVSEDATALRGAGLTKERYIAIKQEEIQEEIALALAKCRHVEDVLEEQGPEVLDWLQRIQKDLPSKLKTYE
ncbi:hypothetical protein [Jeotgalibaca sp. A127]|uniref:hypothetical protein n=1 Tax=Jeotgalibaca sp. A127 TaxID=3457324 RepID=UPI003FD5A5F4